MKVMDFFEGIEDKRAKELIKVITGKRKDDMTKDEFDTIINNSTKIFKHTTFEELDAIQNESESNRLVVHFIAGNNVQEVLKVK